MLMDEATITISGGHGGPGIVSFGPLEGSGPDGGNGGRGGDLYVRASSDMTLLNQFSRQTSFAAPNGHPGGKQKMTGKDGNDLELLLPVGTSLIDTDNGEVLIELKKVDQRELLCIGGKGGKGNWEFRSPRRTTPKFAQPGEPGQKYEVKVILKLIAQYGLVGLPNAGKSSLLNELTRANAKIANYAFTTLSPNLGVHRGRIIADIPGLIEGAHEGRGLGISFLKHIEKVKVILHCIAADSADPMGDYETVIKELRAYKPALLRKKEIILITKSDLVDVKTIKEIQKKFSKTTLPVSIHDWDSLEKLKEILV